MKVTLWKIPLCTKHSGSLIYMTITMLDLSYAVGMVIQFMQTPRMPQFGWSEVHIEVHKTYFIVWNFYETKSQLQVHGYIHYIDWASNVLNKRLTNGFMFFFGSGVVSLNNKKQPIVVISSTEAKYIGASIARCEVIWFQKLLSVLG